MPTFLLDLPTFLPPGLGATASCGRRDGGGGGGGGGDSSSGPTSMMYSDGRAWVDAAIMCRVYAEDRAKWTTKELGQWIRYIRFLRFSELCRPGSRMILLKAGDLSMDYLGGSIPLQRFYLLHNPVTTRASFAFGCHRPIPRTSDASVHQDGDIEDHHQRSAHVKPRKIPVALPRGSTLDYATTTCARLAPDTAARTCILEPESCTGCSLTGRNLELTTSTLTPLVACPSAVSQGCLVRVLGGLATVPYIPVGMS